MSLAQPPRWPRKVALLDHAFERLDWISPARAVELIRAGKVDIVRTKRRIQAVRFRPIDPRDYGGCSPARPHRGLGMPHRRENYYNVRGQWHIDFVPRRLRRIFAAVVEDCTVA